MRFLGILLVLAGLGLAIGYPLYQADFSGQEFHRAKVYDRKFNGGTTAWNPVSVELAEDQNPLRIRLEGKRAAGDSYLGATLPVDIELIGPDGVVMAAELDMTLSTESNDVAPVSQRLFISAPDFDVFTAGTHTLTVTPGIDRDISLLEMNAIFVQNVERQDFETLRPGMIMAGIGAGLWFLGGRRRKRRRKKREKRDQNPKPRRPRWGRQ